MPVVLEDEAGCVARRGHKGDDGLALRAIPPGGLAEIEIQGDALGAEDLAAGHQPAAIHPPGSGPGAQDRNRVVGLGGRPAADQPAGSDLPQLGFDFRVFELAPKIDQQPNSIEMHVDSQCGGATALGQPLLGFDALQHARP